ncbi:PP2C family protein-serine/threonine phosphatase [bacterium]|nr:PP2C family protein-serine/threonine phosphatase [bacterium]MBR6462456.1 PP2C family protein-serine/threonine phosphatase [bacterium]
MKFITDVFRYLKKVRSAAKRLDQTEEAEKRLQGELKIASDIQRSLLPNLERVNKGDQRIETAGILCPAQSVGGDLFNVFFVDRSHLCFCMGDVSGKGISAALYMAVVQTLIRSVARYNASPAAILDHINKDRSANNESCMFVTLFIAVINLRSGTMAYCNGGHNPPVIMKANGRAEFLRSNNGALVGMCSDMEYHDDYMVLRPGDTIFLYTDGVTEAFNTNEKMYGDERLISFLQGKNGFACEKLIGSVWDDVKAFAAGAPQSDDITMLSVRYLGNEVKNA